MHLKTAETFLADQEYSVIMNVKNIPPGIPQWVLDELKKEDEEYEAWQRRERDVPAWLDAYKRPSETGGCLQVS